MKQQDGYFRYYKKYANEPIYKDPYLLQLYLHIKTYLCWDRPRTIKIRQQSIMLEIGQIARTRKQLAEELSTPGTTIYARLKRLEQLGYISITVKHRVMIITDLNWRTEQYIPE